MQSQSSDTFPSHNGNDPISCYDPAFYYYNSRPFSPIDSESNPTSKQDNNNNCDLVPSPTPLSFFHFPSSPFEDTQNQILLEQHHDFLLQFHHQSLPKDPVPQPAVITTMDPFVKKSDQIQRKRPGKRDRHSKINTARGLRDRRMRLSLEVAKRFFGLQDMLNFDKASKTVEWLLNQAKVEINRLVKEKKKNDHHHQSCSSASSECEEGVSSLDEVVVSRDQEQQQQQQQEKVEKVVKRRVKNSRKISAFDPLAKECRERARERARERTREKMRSRGVLAEESKQCGEETNQDLIQLGSSNPFETGDQESGAKTSHSVDVHPSSLDVIATEAKEQSYRAVKEHNDDDDDSLVVLSKWSPSLIFNNSGFSQDHQFAEFQSLGKPWET
ncbi:hypothetical protein AAZX31_04G139100 [Glycine max]|uniref:TCP domain-containing protein n=1 Tax=Glycine max TaxID=3847 RepID=K7KK45_SOYBN|nr:transcription factor DICHOTOMA [Glycine max]XP_025984031.1 transcription factor DICHOTOMA [Glycine max]KAG5066545.1 hypothetical protein JHK86_010276 [Glycine max]KAH1111473.1 hypothetical protein GYH30_010029 [Glycine max]KAH1254352.1 Transcription factor TB1 [Glycine max]KRH63059.1 hypothetical protein GLYMA_04G152400v4 [Glycine max]|eukprot:XP_003524020.1 transcription factor DICHOTOMA [Glycine max]